MAPTELNDCYSSGVAFMSPLRRVVFDERASNFRRRALSLSGRVDWDAFAIAIAPEN